MTGKPAEIVGLPKAYMELSDGYGFVRFLYRSIAFKCNSRDQALGAIEHIMAEIAFHLGEDGVVIWRKPPEIEREWFRMRLATSPPLPDAFWKKYEQREGSLLPEWKDIHP